MGAEVIIALAAAGMNAYNQNQALQDRNEEFVRGIQLQDQKQREADALVNSEIEQVKGSTPEAERDEATRGFIDQLRRARSQDPSNPVYGSSQFAEDTDTANRSVDDFTARAADTMARINAPLRQREREQRGFGRLQTNIGGVQRASAGDNFLTQLRAQSIQPDPGIGMASSLLQGAASGAAGSRGGFRTEIDPAGYSRMIRGSTRVDMPAHGLTRTSGLS